MTFLTRLPNVTLQRFEPFPRFDDVRREMETFFDRFERRYPLAPTNGDAWMPTVDAFEKDGKIFVKAELPGLERDDIHVYVTDQTLVIEGKRERDEQVEKENWFRREISYGEFVRRIALPTGVKPEEIHAAYENGILEVSIPKVEVQKPKEIPIPIA